MQTEALKQYLKSVVRHTVESDNPKQALADIMDSLNRELADTVRGNKQLSARLAEELNKAIFRKRYYTEDGVRNIKFKPFKQSDIYRPPKRPDPTLYKEAEELAQMRQMLIEAAHTTPPEHVDIVPRVSKAFMFLKQASARQMQQEREERQARLDAFEKEQLARDIQYKLNKLATAYEKARREQTEAMYELARYTTVGELTEIVRNYDPSMEISMEKVASLISREDHLGEKRRALEEFGEKTRRARYLADSLKEYGIEVSS